MRSATGEKPGILETEQNGAGRSEPDFMSAHCAANLSAAGLKHCFTHLRRGKKLPG